MKTKTKKPSKKALRPASPAKPILGRHFAVWLTVIILTIVVVSYQIVRANNDDGLPLTTPTGSVAREAQLDAIELQQESQNDQTYDQQQMVNAQGDSSSLNQLVKVSEDAAQ